VPQGTRNIQPRRPGESSTLAFSSTWSPSSIRLCSDAILACLLCSTVRAYTGARHRCVMKIDV
jgi:hypothetical protein